MLRSARCQVEEDGSLPTILERKAEMRGELNGKHEEAYDKFRYENAHRGCRLRICFSGGDDSVDSKTRNNMDVLRDNMEYCSRSDSYRRSSSITRSSRQLSVLASTIQW